MEKLNVMVEITYVSNNNEDGDTWFTAYKICPGSCDDYWIVIRNQNEVFNFHGVTVRHHMQKWMTKMDISVRTCFINAINDCVDEWYNNH